MDIYPDRRSIRLPGFDYRSPRGYFVSLVTQDRSKIFGRIQNCRVELSPEGKIVVEEWIKTPEVRPTVSIDEWVVMPDHFQAIVCINEDKERERKEEIGDVGAASWPPEMARDEIERNGKRIDLKLLSGPPSRSLGRLIGQFKATTTRRINTLLGRPTGTPVWQRNYHDRIIRNVVELDRIRQYIRDNPKNAFK